MKRAAIITVDEPTALRVAFYADVGAVDAALGDASPDETRIYEPSERLLADLRLAADALMYAGGDEGYPMVVDPGGCLAAAARVRAAIGDTDGSVP